jgi:hypothetical protein
MHSTGTRLIVTLLSALTLPAAAAAQAARPLAARSVSIDQLCGAQASLTPPVRSIRILGGAEPMKALFAPGDSVTINAGTRQGVSAGQHYYVRRVVEDRFTVRTTEKQPYSIHTAGWVTVTEASADSAFARVSEACDGIGVGDYLEPLVLPPPPATLPAGEPDFAHPAHIILGDERRQLGAGGGSLMVIDRGSDHGLRAGQRLTIFRSSTDGSGRITAIGDAMVSTTQFETSLIRIDKSSDVIEVGDLVAIHRTPAVR